MAKLGIYLTPTLSCYGIMVRKPYEDFLPPGGKIKNQEVMKQGLNALKVGRSSLSPHRRGQSGSSGSFPAAILARWQRNESSGADW